MSLGRSAAALAAGVVLGSLPFWRYAAPPWQAAPHADHEPHHGGQLGMAGEHHVELVRGARGVEVYVSDAWRRPVRPATAWLVLDDGPPVRLRGDGERLVADLPAQAREAEIRAVLADGARLAITFPLATN